MSLMIVVTLATKEVAVAVGAATVVATAMRVLMVAPVVAGVRVEWVPLPPPGGRNRMMDTRRRLPGRQ